MSMAKAIVCPPAESHRPGQRADADERPRLGPAAVLRGRAAHALADRPGAPGHRERRPRTRRRRPGRASPRAGARPGAGWCDRRARARSRRRPAASGRSAASWVATTPTPAAVVPAPPNAAPRSLSSISARKLSEGTLVRRMRSRIGGEATRGQLLRRRPARCRRRCAPSTRMPSARRTFANWPAAWAAAVPSLREAAVEGQRAQHAADVAVVGAAGVEGAAQEVEARLVAEDRPVDAQDPGRADRARQALQVVAARAWDRRRRAGRGRRARPRRDRGTRARRPWSAAWRRARSASGRRPSCRASRPRRARAGASALGGEQRALAVEIAHEGAREAARVAHLARRAWPAASGSRSPTRRPPEGRRARRPARRREHVPDNACGGTVEHQM